ncbi:MAG: HEPN domain-containing protein [Aestuariivirga sp.]|nr:HEPN domain-containing protein [Aestuariivirga sp.]
MPSNLDDIEFILNEWARFETGLHDRTVELTFEDLMSQLHSRKKPRTIIIGKDANSRLYQLAKRGVQSFKQQERIDVNSVARILGETIVEWFLEERRDLDRSQADRVVSSSVKKAMGKKTAIKHFFPVLLGDGKGPESISLGPAKLLRKDIFFEQYADAFNALMSVDLGPEVAEGKIQVYEGLTTDARKYFEVFPWIAMVEVTDCDPTTSRKTALKIAESATDCLHVLIGEKFSQYLRLEGNHARVKKSSEISQYPNSRFHVTSRIDWPQDSLGEDWWKITEDRMPEGTVALMGKAISEGHKFPQSSPFARRFLDAIAWYREAVRDEYLPSKIVKYVTSLERILCTEEDAKIDASENEAATECVPVPIRDISATIERRGKALLSSIGIHEFEKKPLGFKRIYGKRSALVHGSLSNSSIGLWHQVREAEFLSRWTLVGAVHFLGEDGLTLQKANNEILRTAFDRFIDHLSAN